jgi:hypothetical protein
MDTEQKDITLPLEVLDGRFTLEQVGAISVLMGIPYMTNEQVDHWGSIPEFIPVINNFVKTGIAKAVPEDDGGIKLEIDLS